jgi:hypothetical protein
MNTKRNPKKCTLAYCWILIVLLIMGCRQRDQTPDSRASPEDVLATVRSVQGWSPKGEIQTFNKDTLYDLVNGQAEVFFAYGFERVATQTYENAAGVGLRAELWQVSTPADAYGLLTTSIAGDPIDVGNGGDTDPGLRIAFWQDRYYASVRARQEISDTELQAFTRAIAQALPKGGEVPSLVNDLPPDGLKQRSVIFFHEEISIQHVLWLGGTNVLGLSQATDGVLARYELGEHTAQVLLIQYPEAAEAQTGLTALENAEPADLVTAQAKDDVLGAVFGPVDEGQASAVLTAALQ